MTENKKTYPPKEKTVEKKTEKKTTSETNQKDSIYQTKKTYSKKYNMRKADLNGELSRTLSTTIQNLSKEENMLTQAQSNNFKWENWATYLNKNISTIQQTKLSEKSDKTLGDSTINDTEYLNSTSLTLSYVLKNLTDERELREQYEWRIPTNAEMGDKIITVSPIAEILNIYEKKVQIWNKKYDKWTALDGMIKAYRSYYNVEREKDLMYQLLLLARARKDWLESIMGWEIVRDILEAYSQNITIGSTGFRKLEILFDSDAMLNYKELIESRNKNSEYYKKEKRNYKSSDKRKNYNKYNNSNF